jgi:hypothetical protein
MAQDITNEDETHDKQMQLSDAEEALKLAQKDVAVRQKEGFDDNMQQKMLDIQMNAWAMVYSAGQYNDAPDIIANKEVDILYCNMKDRAGIVPCS